jgi:hypothetical protein
MTQKTLYGYYCIVIVILSRAKNPENFLNAEFLHETYPELDSSLRCASFRMTAKDHDETKISYYTDVIYYYCHSERSEESGLYSL